MSGVAAGLFVDVDTGSLILVLPALWGLALVAWSRRSALVCAVLLAAGFCSAAAILAVDAKHVALNSPLRTALDARAGGFAIDGIGPGARHEPILTRVTLLEDAAVFEDFVSLRVNVIAIHHEGRWLPAGGGATLSVGGRAADPAGDWRAGRVIEAPVTFRRPARYLNDGVPDFERALALDGTALFGSIKSALLVEVIRQGSAADEAAAQVRARVRRSISRWVAPHGIVPAAIVTAVLIGDRSGLPDDVRDRLQAAGTFHVIAISGGNIAILTAVIVGLLRLTTIHGRVAALLSIVALLAYAHIASAGPSVWRATLMAVLYLAARVLDHRTAPWQAVCGAAVVMLLVRPLDARDAGFILTFGATLALLEGARRGHALAGRSSLVMWIGGALTASLAAEVALLPVSAEMFSRVTGAGLLLNLLAVPLMGVAQIAGLIVALVSMDTVASAAGYLAHAAAAGIVDSARLVDVAPWLTARVPPPGLALIVTYYVALGAAGFTRGRVRAGATLALVVAATAIVTGVGVLPASSAPPALRLSVFDVGQGESMLLQFPGGGSMLVDAGGAPFGGGSFDIGARVLAPALWRRGIRRLDTLVVTHGDPDHLGGAASVVQDFAPPHLWLGIPVPPHQPTRDLLDLAARRGVTVEEQRAATERLLGGARVRVLHPPPPDWERQRVRNDDSIVLEVVYRDVAILLTGDISAEIERSLVPLLSTSPVRILKAAHHGSRTSSSRALLEAWRPQIALISAGRGNTFGHPTPQVLERLQSIGATVLRTDLHGQVTLETDGSVVQTSTYLGEKR